MWPSFGVRILLRHLGTTQAHLTPNLATEKNTAFCLSLFTDPRLSLRERQKFEILRKVVPKPHSFMFLRLYSPNVLSQVPLHYFQFLTISWLFLCAAYVHTDGRGARTVASKEVG